MGYYYYGIGNSSTAWTWVLLAIAAVFSMICSSKVKSTYKKYARVMASSGMTGAEVAKKILQREGMYDVQVQHISGELTDHFNPATKIVNLSDSVYSSASVAAIGVAAHECGHAMQHNEGYFPLKLRSSIVPVANFGSKAAIPIIVLGCILSSFNALITVGILLFSASVLFQIVTLPVEFDASRRALETIKEMGIVREGAELEGSKAVLKSAAMTYVAAAAASIVSLIRIIAIYGGRGKRRD